MPSPFTFTPRIINLVAAISEKIGEANAYHFDKLPASIGRSNRIRSIQSSLAIDGCVLSTDQIGSIQESGQSKGPAKGILDAKNALEVYDKLDQFHSTKLSSFQRAHRLMMAGLMEAPGKLRTRHVESIDRGKPAYSVLDGNMVKRFILSLFEYLKNSDDPVLIKSCVFHYELDFIHPFAAGNGRLGRLWQMIILREQYPVMECLPVEAILYRDQERYFEALNKGGFPGSSTDFIEFILGAILESMGELLSGRVTSLTAVGRMERFRSEIGNRFFSRKEYLGKYKEISTATASRDLQYGVNTELLQRTGHKRNSIYRFVSGDHRIPLER
jgi:Fic family protein